MFGHVRIAVIVRLRVIYFRYSECKGSNNICIPPLVERGLYCNHLVRPFVRQFTLLLNMSQLLLEEMILFLIHDFGIATCTVSPLSGPTSCLQCDLAFFMFAVIKTCVTDILASTGRNDLIYGFCMVNCTMSPLSRFTAHLLPVYRMT